MQSPEAELVARSLGIKDFFVLLGGSIVGQLIASADTLSVVNVGIGIPIGVFGSTKYVKNLMLKEFLMGMGLGMTVQGLNDVLAYPISTSIEKALPAGTKTIASQVKDWVNTWLQVTPTPSGAKETYGAPTLEETGYIF
jgi:hypothetical protein